MATTEPSTNDRLGFTLILAAALNALVIFGVANIIRINPQVAPALNITLATHKSEIEPESADFLAQHNQEASGDAEDINELTTDQRADFAANEAREVIPLPQEKTTLKSQQQDNLLTTTTQTDASIDLNDDSEESQQEKEAQDEDIPEIPPEKAALLAKLDRIKQQEARRPKVRRMNSVRAKASKDAEYLNRWNEKVEQVARQHFPEEALRQDKFDMLRLAVTIKPDGSILNVEIISPSQYPILNQSAVQIAHLASPFDPIPKEVIEDYDQLEIIRTWTFMKEGMKSEGFKRTKTIE